MIRTIARVGVAAAGFALFVSATPIHAQTWDKLMYLTFSGAVQIPKVRLAAGTYRFRLADGATNRSVMQVLNRDGSHLYGNYITLPRLRHETTDDPVVMFKETPPGIPPEIRALFYPAEYTGWEFIYPKVHHDSVTERFEVGPLVFGAGLRPTSLD